jgi:predicted TIM-barrel fold metal-dependent hydrolase
MSESGFVGSLAKGGILMFENSSLSRRDLLKTGGLGIAALALGASPSSLSQAQEPEAKKMGWIDAHSHIWTRDIAKYPLQEGKTLQDLDPPSFTTEELIETASKEDVSRGVLIAHNIYYRYDNSYMIDAARQHPRKFRIVGMIDETKPDPGQEMRKLLKQQVNGFRITPRVRGREVWLKSEGMQAMWKTAGETGQAMCCLVDPEDLPDISAMCRKHPETPVVIDHFARIGADGEIREKDVKQLCDLAGHTQVSVKVSAFYALGKKQPPYLDLVPMIRRLVDAYGPERLMWASDSPYQLVGEHTYAASIELIRDRVDFLSATDREWLLRKTAEKVYLFE